MPSQSLPKLLVPRQDALPKIQEQITKGRNIVDSLSPPAYDVTYDLKAAFQKAQVDQQKWAKFTIHLLQTLFDGIKVSDEFGHWVIIPSPYEDMVECLIRFMNARISNLESLVERLEMFPESDQQVGLQKSDQTKELAGGKVFVVHGHDDGAKDTVARFIEKLGLDPIILHERADQGRTVIEKIEKYRDVRFTVVLLTPDDVGGPKGQDDGLRPRARQNVIFELGFFIGSLERSRVVALTKGNVEIPSDYHGVLYVSLDTNWQLRLAREFNAAGLEVDFKRVV